MKRFAIAAALAAVVALPVAGSAIELVPMNATNTRMSGCDPASVSEGVLAWAAGEGEQGRDMNHNKSLYDRVLVYLDTRAGGVHNTKLTTGQAVVIDAGLIAFELGHPGSSDTLAFYAIKDTPYLRKGLLDTGIPSQWGATRRNTLHQGRFVYTDALGQVTVFDVKTQTARTIAQGSSPTIHGDLVVYGVLRIDETTGYGYYALVYQDLATGTVTETGVRASQGIGDGSGIVYGDRSALGYYDLQTGQATALVGFGHFDDFGFGNGVIAMTAWEDDVWGDLNGDGVIGAYGGYLVLYDVQTGRLVNTGVQACCGGDVSGGIVAFDIYEGSDHTLTDLNGDGDINDCIMQWMDISAWLGR